MMNQVYELPFLLSVTFMRETSVDYNSVHTSMDLWCLNCTCMVIEQKYHFAEEWRTFTLVPYGQVILFRCPNLIYITALQFKYFNWLYQIKIKQNFMYKGTKWK